MDKIEPKGLYLSKQIDKNWGLYLINESVEKYIALKQAVFDGQFKLLNPFFQSDSNPLFNFFEQKIMYEEGKEFDHHFLFIEFWTNNQELILELSLQFAKTINTELLLEDF